jgi:hypothetical protein
MKQIVFALIFAAAPAAAQFGDSTRIAGSFGAGFTEPVNPIARNLDTGWNVAGGIGVRQKYMGVLLDFLYTDFGINRRTLAQFGVPQGDQKYWALTVDPIVHLNPHGPVDFYITGGGGLYSQITDLRGGYGYYGSYGDRHDLLSYTLYKGGVDGGVGFAFHIGLGDTAKFFAEARYHHMFVNGSNASFVPVTLGIRF